MADFSSKRFLHLEALSMNMSVFESRIIYMSLSQTHKSLSIIFFRQSVKNKEKIKQNITFIYTPCPQKSSQFGFWQYLSF